jgi:F-type H+-transporting ATPase subunit gamma
VLANRVASTNTRIRCSSDLASTKGRPLVVITQTADQAQLQHEHHQGGRRFREHRGRAISLGLVGRKGRDFFARRGLPVRFEHTHLPKVITFAEAEVIAAPAIKDFVDEKIDSVYLIYYEFKSVMQQRVVVEPLLPLTTVSAAEEEEGAKTDYLYEPSPDRILDVLLHQLVQAQVLRALVESNAAFFAAQMTAMDAATRNSSEMIDGLTLYMNKLRQAAITREIIEVVSGSKQ